jgi:hypothetical protein
MRVHNEIIHSDTCTVHAEDLAARPRRSEPGRDAATELHQRGARSRKHAELRPPHDTLAEPPERPYTTLHCYSPGPTPTVPRRCEVRSSARTPHSHSKSRACGSRSCSHRRNTASPCRGICTASRQPTQPAERRTQRRGCRAAAHVRITAWERRQDAAGH